MLRKIHPLVILFFLIVLKSGAVIANIGLADEYDTSPCGTQIQYVEGKTSFIIGEKEISFGDPDNFYFYKCHIIGYYRLGTGNFPSSDTALRYFVLNEKTAELDTFKSRNEWQAFLSRYKLTAESIEWRYNKEGLDKSTMNVAVIYLFALAIGIPLVVLLIVFIKKKRK